jgi:hypothetical protein
MIDIRQNLRALQVNIQTTWILLARGDYHGAFYNLILCHLYRIREVENSLQKMEKTYCINKSMNN